MKTIQEMVDVMNHYANGGEVEGTYIASDSGQWLVDVNPSWNWTHLDYRKKEHAYKVGDWVEVGANHCPSRVGDVVQITKIDDAGDLWAGEGYIIFDNINTNTEGGTLCKIKPASKTEPQKPKYKPFTAETFPKGVVWIRCHGESRGYRDLVVCVASERVHGHDSYWTYTLMLDNAQISLDGGQTWQKAGEEVK